MLDWLVKQSKIDQENLVTLARGGGGGLPYKSIGDARRKCSKIPLKDTGRGLHIFNP
jgi:hypothetical protein